jgi:hypothetical protein
MHLWTLATVCLASATCAFLLDNVTSNWSYAVAPPVAAVVAGGLELRRSDVTVALGTIVAAFVDTGLLMIFGAFVKYFIHVANHVDGGGD